MSVYVPILEGKYDAELKWPFMGKVTFTLLNQLEDKNHHTDVMTLDATDNALIGSAWGLDTFIQHSELTQSADCQWKWPTSSHG